MFTDILAKMEHKKECYHYLSLSNFPKIKILFAKQVSDQWFCNRPTLFILVLASANFQHWSLCLSDVLILMHCMIYFSKLQPSQRTYQSSQTEIDIHVHAKQCVQASGRECGDGQHREFRDTSGRRRRRLCIALHSHCKTHSFNQSAYCYVYISFTVTCRRLVLAPLIIEKTTMRLWEHLTQLELPSNV